MKNVMLDLETMSTASNAAIISIGACEFDEFGVEENTFYRTISLDSCTHRGLQIDGSTIEWWLKQSSAAQKAITKDNEVLGQVLKAFAEWLPKDNVQVWGNGSDFDCVILQNAYKTYNGTEPPWPFWNNRCFRTMQNSFPSLELDRKGTHHNALDDAIFQAEYLIKLIEKNNLGTVL